MTDVPPNMLGKLDLWLSVVDGRISVFYRDGKGTIQRIETGCVPTGENGARLSWAEGRGYTLVLYPRHGEDPCFYCDIKDA